MRVTMIGHSTVLIELDGMTVLTDPYFGRWGNPAYKRLAAPSKTRDELDGVQLVLISHHHFDHVDRRFLQKLSPDVPVIVPDGTAWLTKLHGAKNVVGMRRWTERRFGSLSITAVPAAHMATSSGYVLQGEGKSIYFSGDTFHRPFMKEIGGRFRLDLALMPVTTYLLPMTMGEKAAVRAARDLAPSVVIPIHLGLTPRSPLMRRRETPEGFARRVREAGLDTRTIILGAGDSWIADDRDRRFHAEPVLESERVLVTTTA